MIDIYDDPKQLNLYPKDNSGLYVGDIEEYVDCFLIILTPKEIKIKKRSTKCSSVLEMSPTLLEISEKQLK